MVSRALLAICGGAVLFVVVVRNDVFSDQAAPKTGIKKTAKRSFFDLLPGKTWSKIKAGNREAIRQANRQLAIGHCAPNVVLIVVDDLGYGDLGCYGQKRIKTPRIDKMAAEGIRFTRFYAGDAVGTPSRCSMLTGLHTGHCRLRGNTPPLPLQPQDVTIAEVLWKAGYDTFQVGTWALGDVNTPGTPNRQGYDNAFGYLNRKRARNYFPPFLWRNEQKEMINANRDNGRGSFSHDLLTQEALSIVSSRHRRPFFLHLARFLQFDFESTVIVRGWVGVISVWHHAPCGC